MVDAPLPDKAYDLVISREVLEHLPVRDVHAAVINMCRISARFVYVTTRFHPAPKSLLDVTTEFDVDPTHITVMNKNLLRTMFVLAGFAAAPTSSSAWTGWISAGCSSTNACRTRGETCRAARRRSTAWSATTSIR